MNMQQRREISKQILAQGLKLKRKGKYNEARKFYEKAIHIWPYERFAYYNLAKVHYILENQQASVENYLKTIGVDLFMLLRNVDRMNKTARFLQGKEIKATNPYRDDPNTLFKYGFKHHPIAPLVLMDPDVLLHLGHSFLDFNSELPETLKQDKMHYRAMVMDNPHFENEEGNKVYRQVGYENYLKNYAYVKDFINYLSKQKKPQKKA